MKILQISRDVIEIKPDAGGIESYIFDLSKSLSELGHQVTILGRRHPKTKIQVGSVQGVNMVYLTTCNVPDSIIIRTRSFLAMLLREFNQASFSVKIAFYLMKYSKNFDVIAIHLPLTGIILSILRQKDRNKFVYTSHTNYWGLSLNRIGFIEKQVLALDSWMMRRTNKIIAQTEQLKIKYVTLGDVNPAKIELVPEGIDTKLFNPNIEIGVFKRENNLDGRFIILFVGRLSKIKGADYLVKAVNILVNEWRYNHVLLILIGPRSAAIMGSDKPLDMEKMLYYINTTGIKRNIMFAGLVSQEKLLRFYATCNVFVLPSLAELFPMVISEAMASGKPIIATKIGGIPAQVKDGWNGFLVEPENERYLAEKIKFLLDNPEKCQEMGVNSRQYAEEYFDWSKIAYKISFAYESVVRGKM